MIIYIKKKKYFEKQYKTKMRRMMHLTICNWGPKREIKDRDKIVLFQYLKNGKILILVKLNVFKSKYFSFDSKKKKLTHQKRSQEWSKSLIHGFVICYKSKNVHLTVIYHNIITLISHLLPNFILSVKLLTNIIYNTYDLLYSLYCY